MKPDSSRTHARRQLLKVKVYTTQGMEKGRDEAKQVTGRCLLMCPEAERLRRERLQQLAVFEVDSRTGHPEHGRAVSSSSLAVKEYVRAGAGHHVPRPSELRPPKVLVETMEYLMTSIVDRREHPWHVVYGFVNNRCQSVRQDITYQQLEGPDVVHIYELASRFYIYAQYRLADVPLERFDPKLNRDQIQQCLSKLLRLYSEAEHTAVARWAEFESYFLLTNLGSSEALTHALELPPQIRRKESCLQTAVKLSLSSLQNNFIRFFRLVSHLAPLAKQGLQILCNAFSMSSRSSLFPLSILARWFMYNGEQEVAAYCHSLGLTVEGSNVFLQRHLHFCNEEIEPYFIPEIPTTEHKPSVFIALSL